MIHARPSISSAAAVLLALASSVGCGNSNSSKPTPGREGGAQPDAAAGGSGGIGIVGNTDAGLVDAGPVDASVGNDDTAIADAATDGRPVLPAAAIPAPWVSEDIGMVGVAGGAGRTNQGA